MSRTTELTQQERNVLADAYQDALDRDEGLSWRNGSHYILIHTLGILGYSVNSSEAAERMADKLLYGGH